MAKRSADAAGVKSKDEEEASHRQRTAENSAGDTAATAVIAATVASAASATNSLSPASAVAAAANSIAVSTSSSSSSASTADPLLALRSVCDEFTFTYGLLTRCFAEKSPTKTRASLMTALQSSDSIDFSLLVSDQSVLAHVASVLPWIYDRTDLTELLSLLQPRLHQWHSLHVKDEELPGRVPLTYLLLQLFCVYDIVTPFNEAQLDFLEQLAATLLTLGADMTAVSDANNTIAMIIANQQGGQTLLTRMLRTPCKGMWSAAAMLTMVWHRNVKNESLLGMLRRSPAPHDSTWSSNLGHVKAIRLYWSQRVKPVITEILVECGLAADVAHICLDYIDGFDRTNPDRINDSEVDEPEPEEEDAGDDSDAEAHVESEDDDAESDADAAGPYLADVVAPDE